MEKCVRVWAPVFWAAPATELWPYNGPTLYRVTVAGQQKQALPIQLEARLLDVAYLQGLICIPQTSMWQTQKPVWLHATHGGVVWGSHIHGMNSLRFSLQHEMGCVFLTPLRSSTSSGERGFVP